MEEEDKSKIINIIGGWLISYRKFYTKESDRKHVNKFLSRSKYFFEERLDSPVDYKYLFDKYSWEEWSPLVSSFYLTYTLW